MVVICRTCWACCSTRVVEQIEELGAELQGLSFGELRGLDEGCVPVELAGPKQNAQSGVAVGGGLPSLPTTVGEQNALGLQ